MASDDDPVRNRERIEAALLGLAVADALGAPLETFWADEAAAAARRGLEMTGGGKYAQWLPGEWTDDTAMALCLAESIGECGVPLDLDDVARRYAAWAASGPKDIGNITSASLSGVESADDARAKCPQLPRADGTAAGNGTVMRVAPLAFAPPPIGTWLRLLAMTPASRTGTGPRAIARRRLCVAMRAVCRGDDPVAAASAVVSHPRVVEAVEVAREAGSGRCARAGPGGRGELGDPRRGAVREREL